MILPAALIALSGLPDRDDAIDDGCSHMVQMFRHASACSIDVAGRDRLDDRKVLGGARRQSFGNLTGIEDVGSASQIEECTGQKPVSRRFGDHAVNEIVNGPVF